MGSGGLEVAWSIDGLEYASCSQTGDNNRCFKTTKTFTDTISSILTIDILDTGSHSVQCLVRQTLDSLFESDESFVSNEAAKITVTLTVLPGQSDDNSYYT